MAGLIFAVSGCGAAEPADTKDDRVVVAALGDSITAGSPLWDPDPAIRETIPAPDEASQFEYWAARADPRLEFRNCGIFGEPTDEIAARLEECADGADVLVVQGGINDIAQNQSVEDAAANLRGIVRAGKERGLEVALVDVLPWNNGHPAADGPIAELNRLIGEIGRDEGVEVLPFHDALEDPDEPGTMAAGLTDDGNHPSVAGYRRLGDLFADLATREGRRGTGGVVGASPNPRPASSCAACGSPGGVCTRNGVIWSSKSPIGTSRRRFMGTQPRIRCG